MRIHRLFTTSILTISVSFPSLCLATPPKVIQEMETHLRGKWIPVEYKAPVGFETIFNELDPSLWPALPESYEWRIEKDKVSLYKHKKAETHQFDFVTYATDNPTRYNFLSRWDGITRHSFAYTRPESPLSSQHTARSVYPMQEFRFNGQTYMRGHCIDFLDSGNLSEHSIIGRGTKYEFLSTTDPRNYIPEPRDPTPYWGETLRKELVKNIRKESGCYAQYMLYGHKPNCTSDESRTAIPKGIYFLKLDASKSLEASYRVPWDHKIHEGKKKATWQDDLETLLEGEKFYPGPNVFDGEGSEKRELPTDYISKVTSTKEIHKLARAADYEVSNVTGKTNLLLNLLKTKDTDPSQVQYWLTRFIKHVVLLHKKNQFGILNKSLVTQIIEGVKKEALIDTGKKFSPLLTQLLKEDEAKKIVVDKKVLSVLKSVNIPQPTIAPKVINVDGYNSQGAITVVKSALKKGQSLRLTNMISTRATAIANAIVKEYEKTPEKLKDLSIEYSPKKNSTQVKNISSAFEKVGIPIRKMGTETRATGTPSTAVRSPEIKLSPKSSYLTKHSKRRLPFDDTEEEKTVEYLRGLSNEDLANLLGKVEQERKPVLHRHSVDTLTDED